MIVNLAVIPGDGVGPEMTQPALEVLKAVCAKYNHKLEIHMVLAGGAALDEGLEPLPAESLKICQKVPAVLFGNSGLSKYQNNPIERRPEAALMGLRRGLGVTTNIRPVKYYPELAAFSPLKDYILKKGLDIVFVRDIIGGVFCSDKVKSVGSFGKEAYEYEYYNESIVKYTAEIAMELAIGRKKRVVRLDKSNVLESSRLWRQTVEKVAEKYPGLFLTHYYIDNAAMKVMVEPWNFDVVVTSNLFGDIIADEGTQMTGTQYLYASAELNREGHAIYTPNQLHHPDETLIGQQVVNPIGMIMAVSLMLRYSFGLAEEAENIERAVDWVIRRGYATRDIWTEGKTLLSTEEMGKQIVKEIFIL